MTLQSEIFEQPERLSTLLDDQRLASEKVAGTIRQRNIRWVFLAARGTSDNASWTTPEELTAAVLYLLSDAAATVNGARLPLYKSY